MTEWRPDKLSRRLPYLAARARLQAEMRRWFAGEGFVEVETPILQVAPGAEVHLSGFATEWELPDGEERERWLHSSPEFAMKKLLAGGIPKLFQFARVFRNAEGSALHHPEFTMLEWYRAGVGYETIMADCAALLALTGVAELRWQEHRCDPRAEPERLTVAEAFHRHADVDLFATVGSAERLSRASGVAMHAGDSWDDVFFRVMFEKIEKRLGMGRPPSSASSADTCRLNTDCATPNAAAARLKPPPDATLQKARNSFRSMSHSMPKEQDRGWML